MSGPKWNESGARRYAWVNERPMLILKEHKSHEGKVIEAVPAHTPLAGLMDRIESGRVVVETFLFKNEATK